MTGTGPAARLYRQRAIELRTQAHNMDDENNRKLGLSIADNYDQLAKNIEAIASAAKAKYPN